MKRPINNFICFLLLLVFVLYPLSINSFASDTTNEIGYYGFVKTTVSYKAKITADSLTVASGSTIIVPVKISENSGLMGYNISVLYDNKVLAPISVEQGDAISGGMFNDSIETSVTNSFNVIWSNSENSSGEGILFYIVFKVNENAVGDTYIDLDYVQADTFNESWNDVLLDISDSVITVENTNYSNNMVMAMKSTQAIAGAILSLPITLSNCVEISETTVKLAYDSENFEFIDVVSTSVKVETREEESVVIINIESLSSVHNNTDIFTINFKIKEYISGDFAFDLIYDADIDIEPQNIMCTGCTVSVTNPAKNDPSVIYGEKVSAKVGETITVPVKIKNNHGIMGYKITLSYDSDILNPLSVTSGESFNGNFADNAGMAEDRFDIIWNGNTNVVTDGEIFFVEFETLKQGDTIVSLSYNQGDTFNEAWEDVILNCQDISVTVHPSELIFAKTGTSTVIDKTDKYIYGLTAGISSLENYITVLDGYTYSVSGKIGTGTVVEVCKNDVVIDTYAVIIFGDVNGDGWYDGTDAVIVSCIANGMLIQEQAGSVICFAADCNHDGLIDENDVALLEQAGVLIAEIDQSQDIEELLSTSSAYVEYAGLIEQLIPLESDIQPEQTDRNWLSCLVDILTEIYKWILKLLMVVADFANI